MVSYLSAFLPLVACASGSFPSASFTFTHFMIGQMQNLWFHNAGSYHKIAYTECVARTASMLLNDVSMWARRVLLPYTGCPKKAERLIFVTLMMKFKKAIFFNIKVTKNQAFCCFLDTRYRLFRAIESCRFSMEHL